MRSLIVLVIVTAACGDDSADPVDAIVFGEPTIIVIANPTVNDDNEAPIPAPGTLRGDIEVEDDTGLFAVTDDDGIAVLSPVDAGSRTIALGNGVDGEVTTTMGSNELREIAIGVDSGAEIMTVVDYDWGANVVELSPDMTSAQIEAALSSSDSFIVLRAGTYVLGDIEMAGSRVTVFGEGVLGRTALIEGNVLVKGSGNRLRGVLIDGNLRVEGSDSGVAFTSVVGTTTVTASGTRLLYNDFCGTVDVRGSGVTAVGNAGMPPLAPICP